MSKNFQITRTRKHEPIDLMKLYSLGSNNGWNEYLTTCLNSKNINALAKLRYQIQVGMTDLANKKINTPEIDVWFIRLNKSIEDTARAIIRKKHPLPGDNPLIDLKTRLSSHDVKKARDSELRSFFKDSAF